MTWGGERWSGSQHVLKVEPTGFADSVDVVLKRKEKKSVMKHRDICLKQMQKWRKTMGKADFGVCGGKLENILDIKINC